ncbi:hypothetical protein EPK99_17090 [Neorhizobium lilium]|uniref:Lysozyme inhibitor LprI N-terminal domain-containing protein n=1 Tax=Neorhizobium lilium TaxID=2503024 RepID=A0A3S3RGR6_9HYPH|nr:hypothetical protein [Neorhizobium lilium]RWX75421.1 hypothetical protein EPK99_17090 [Neorhizobium lilium]
MRDFIHRIGLAGFLFGTGLGAAIHPAAAASFDCERAELAADEKKICDTRSLNDADVKMVTTFDILTGLLPMGSRGTLQEEQSSWLKKRQACNADAECIRNAYSERMKQLDEAYKGLSRPM